MLKDTVHTNTISYERDLKSGSYVRPREKEKEEIKFLLQQGHEPIYYKNFIILNGKTFNGWNEEDIAKLEEE